MVFRYCWEVLTQAQFSHFWDFQYDFKNLFIFGNDLKIYQRVKICVRYNQ